MKQPQKRYITETLFKMYKYSLIDNDKNAFVRELTDEEEDKYLENYNFFGGKFDVEYESKEDEYGIYDSRTDLALFLPKMNELYEANKNKYTSINYDCMIDGDGYRSNYHVIGSRLETDEEFKDRIANELAKEQAKLAEKQKKLEEKENKRQAKEALLAKLSPEERALLGK